MQLGYLTVFSKKHCIISPARTVLMHRLSWSSLIHGYQILVFIIPRHHVSPPRPRKMPPPRHLNRISPSHRIPTPLIRDRSSPSLNISRTIAIPIPVVPSPKEPPITNRHIIRIRPRPSRRSLRRRRRSGRSSYRSLLILVDLHVLSTDVCCSTDGTCCFAQNEPRYEAFGVEFVAAGLEFEYGFWLGGFRCEGMV